MLLAELLGAGLVQGAAAEPAVESVAARVRRISASVEAIRGERFLRPVALRQLSGEQMRRQLRALLDREWPAPKMAAQEQLFKLLGLLPPELDLSSTLIAVLGEQVGGLYDPQDQVMLVGEAMRGRLLDVVLAHELTHALDDQLYGLGRLQELARTSTDLSFALSAVVEGSGTLAMSRFLLEQAGSDPLRLTELLAESGQIEAAQGERLMAAPPFVQRNLMLSYLLGQTFLIDAPAGGLELLTGPALEPRKLARAFRHPPQSSEQVLHPERYWDPTQRDLPSRITFPRDGAELLGPGWKLVERDRLGELNAAIVTVRETSAGAAPSGAGLEGLMEVFMGGDWTTPAADGWDGDAALLFARGGERAAVWISVWDRPEDAAEFHAAYRPIAGPPSGKAVQGKLVAVVIGVDGAAPKAQRLLDEVQLEPEPELVIAP